MLFVALIGALVPITVVSVKKADPTTRFWDGAMLRPNPLTYSSSSPASFEEQRHE
ncbi:hypothetical protein [Thalassovita gelatinovora]|uniref:hypothetical protein n=1 Tax=Thalassovita gelatinovora TaxID=53501 RepID=UPI000B17E4EE|nr:hypothetical protein [Thalassovita gelatinovora]QIZ80508.1 hypothetical protein HFZ77_08450 [Thalassovita gelatinovora]